MIKKIVPVPGVVTYVVSRVSPEEVRVEAVVLESAPPAAFAEVDQEVDPAHEAAINILSDLLANT